MTHIHRQQQETPYGEKKERFLDIRSIYIIPTLLLIVSNFTKTKQEIKGGGGGPLGCFDKRKTTTTTTAHTLAIWFKRTGVPFFFLAVPKSTHSVPPPPPRPSFLLVDNNNNHASTYFTTTYLRTRKVLLYNSNYFQYNNPIFF